MKNNSLLYVLTSFSLTFLFSECLHLYFCKVSSTSVFLFACLWTRNTATLPYRTWAVTMWEFLENISSICLSLSFFSAADHSGPIDEGEPLANAIRSDSAIIGGNRDYKLHGNLFFLVTVSLSMLKWSQFSFVCIRKLVKRFNFITSGTQSKIKHSFKI